MFIMYPVDCNKKKIKKTAKQECKSETILQTNINLETTRERISSSGHRGLTWTGFVSM